jgi:hypothetical protein
MKKLIQIQAVVNAIEDLTLNNQKFHSTFEYQAKDTLIIKTFAVEHTMNLMSILYTGIGYCTYLRDNNTIEVLELPFDDVENESED